MSDHLRLSVVEIADKLGVDREVARGLVRYLVEVGLAQFRGERRAQGSRGKAEHVFSFTVGYEAELVEKLKGAGLG